MDNTQVVNKSLKVMIIYQKVESVMKGCWIVSCVMEERGGSWMWRFHGYMLLAGIIRTEFQRFLKQFDRMRAPEGSRLSSWKIPSLDCENFINRWQNEEFLSISGMVSLLKRYLIKSENSVSSQFVIHK